MLAVEAECGLASPEQAAIGPLAFPGRQSSPHALATGLCAPQATFAGGRLG